MNAARISRLERIARRSVSTGTETDAAALADCITDEELEALAAGADPSGAHPHALADSELAEAIFKDRPDLLATCRKRLAAGGSH